MFVESLLPRKPGFAVAIDGVTYVFDHDAQGRLVARIEDEDHRARLAAVPEGYRTVRAPAVSSDNDDPEEPADEDLDREVLLAEYEIVFGHRPRGRISNQTLRARLLARRERDEAPDDLGDEGP